MPDETTSLKDAVADLSAKIETQMDMIKGLNTNIAAMRSELDILKNLLELKFGPAAACRCNECGSEYESPTTERILAFIDIHARQGHTLTEVRILGDPYGDAEIAPDSAQADA